MISARQLLGPMLLGLLIGTASQLVLSGHGLRYPTSSTPPPAVFDDESTPGMLFPELVPPDETAGVEKWLAFARQVKATPSGTRHGGSDYTTPLLAWYAYIAMHKPEAIYAFYAEQGFNDRTFSHLLQFGLLPDWYQKLPHAQQLLLTDNTALQSLATHQGIDFARDELISAIHSKQQQGFSISGSHLYLALTAMRRDEVLSLLSRIESGNIRIDPRALRTASLSPELQGMESGLLGAMRTQARGSYESRMMSSYFLHGAELGAGDYVEAMLEDVESNAGQPTNFYCAACYLALVADGLAGSTLIEHLRGGDRIYVTRQQEDNPLFGGTVAGDYLLSLEADGGAL